MHFKFRCSRDRFAYALKLLLRGADYKCVGTDSTKLSSRRCTFSLRLLVPSPLFTASKSLLQGRFQTRVSAHLDRVESLPAQGRSTVHRETRMSAKADAHGRTATGGERARKKNCASLTPANGKRETAFLKRAPATLASGRRGTVLSKCALSESQSAT